MRKYITFFVAVVCAGEILFRILFPENIAIIERTFDKDTRIFKSKPRQEGIYIKRHIRNGYFRINNEGWNSPRDYFTERRAGVLRIAVIGACRAEAMSVDVACSYPQVIEHNLKDKGIDCEVYTFAAGSMNLAQALHIARYVMEAFSPDIITIDCPWGGFAGSSTARRYYLSIDVDSTGVVTEIEPRPELQLLNKVQRFIYHSKLILVLSRMSDCHNRMMNMIMKIESLVTRCKYVPWANRPYGSAFPRSTIYKGRSDICTRYILRNLESLAQRYGVKVVFILFPASYASYNWPDGRISPTERNGIRKMKGYLSECSLAYCDLTEVFRNDYAANGIKFDFPYNGHFNINGHKVTGNAVADYLRKNAVVECSRDMKHKATTSSARVQSRDTCLFFEASLLQR